MIGTRRTLTGPSFLGLQYECRLLAWKSHAADEGSVGLSRNVPVWSQQLQEKLGPSIASSLPSDPGAKPVPFLVAALLRFTGMLVCHILMPPDMLDPMVHGRKDV